VCCLGMMVVGWDGIKVWLLVELDVKHVRDTLSPRGGWQFYLDLFVFGRSHNN
jgi:hypothetical protein